MTYRPAEDGSALTALWRGSGTILLVEDEGPVMFVAKTMLEALGFDVLEAANGEEALELCRNNVADISLVVMDIGMPIMDGYDLFHELKRFHPQLPIIVSSGFGDEYITSRIPREEIDGLASKPYTLDQMQKVLRSVLEEKLAKPV